MSMATKNISYLFIGNWKMYFTHTQAQTWAATYFKEISAIAQDSRVKFIFCPSFDALAGIAHYAQESSLSFGAQDCSEHDLGAYTGQVAAASLAQLGCRYTIVGHSETRAYQGVSNNMVARKVNQLLQNNIIPVICIGETQEELEQGNTVTVLRNQLQPILEVLSRYKNSTPIIAYEPVWAIGTDKVPSYEHLYEVYRSLEKICLQSGIALPRFIYGGSVDATTIESVNEVVAIQGILVGRASTDFKKIKSIVSLIKKS